MSKNNKNARRHAEARNRNRVKGYKGPKSTKKLNTKKKAWYQLKDINGILLCLLNKDAAKKDSGKGKKRKKKDSDE